jgi:hypothetical protein
MDGHDADPVIANITFAHRRIWILWPQPSRFVLAERRLQPGRTFAKFPTPHATGAADLWTPSWALGANAESAK